MTMHSAISRPVKNKRLSYAEKQAQDRARFQRATRNHRMTVLQDDGVFRHIRCAQPGSQAYAFNITTFPGYLAFTGDMGSYVFSRLRDMFEFHRINWDHGAPCIDYRYWAQKCEAVDRHSGTDEFNEDHFKEAALRSFWNHAWPDPETRRHEWTLEIRDIIDAEHQDSGEAIRAMMEYGYETYDALRDRHKTIRPFDDFYECGPFTQPSFSLKWACWAIASTIRDYDLGGDRHTRQAAHDKLVLTGKI